MGQINNNTVSYPFDRTAMQHKVEYNAAGDPVYIGRALPGIATSAESWQIRKVTYDSARRPTAILFSSGSNEYAYKWDNRAGLSYS